MCMLGPHVPEACSAAAGARQTQTHTGAQPRGRQAHASSANEPRATPRTHADQAEADTGRVHFTLLIFLICSLLTLHCLVLKKGGGRGALCAGRRGRKASRSAIVRPPPSRPPAASAPPNQYTRPRACACDNKGAVASPHRRTLHTRTLTHLHRHRPRHTLCGESKRSAEGGVLRRAQGCVCVMRGEGEGAGGLTRPPSSSRGRGKACWRRRAARPCTAPAPGPSAA